jgi:DNA-binding transcriptional MerR regulator
MRDFRSPPGSARNGEQLWTIREVASHYGLTLRALRFYEDRGLLRSCREGPTRLYDAATRRRVEVIMKGKQLGFTLTEIRSLIEVSNGNGAPVIGLALEDSQIVEQIELLKQQRAGIDRAIEELCETQRRRGPGLREPTQLRSWTSA